MSVTALPNATIEIFDRSRLLVDLDEATAPESPHAVLLVIGLRQLGDAVARDGSDEIVADLRAGFTELVGADGTDYQTRGSELCAILDDPTVVSRIVTGIEERLAGYGEPLFRAACGIVELPAEADDAVSALTLADRRVTAAHGPVGYD